MSDPASSTPTLNPAPAHATKDPEDRHPHSLVIRVWPNVPILYPMAIAALLCGIFSLMFGVDKELSRLKKAPVVTQTATAQGGTAFKDSDGNWIVLDGKTALVTADPEKIASTIQVEQVIALIFLAAFIYTLIVVCTDIVLTWALLGIFTVVIIGMLMFIINIYHPFLTGFFDFVGRFTPVANAQFYFAIFLIWGLLMLGGILYSRFHYVKIESNEVVVVGGVLDKRKRYSSMRMQYTKEICDVFEYYLPFVRSGRLILRFPQEAEPVIIDHVMHVDRVIAKLDHVTATLQVAPEDKDEATQAL
ncbi:MAG TPA: hypothetical protein VG796_04050 [Verrucomicrobiales bacterium]|jgi:hypothetical protein|nr:hypothetical protein [Verrucomicrobiales bacterium]